MAKPGELQAGDFVSCFINGHPHTGTENLYVVGVMRYAADDLGIVLLADDEKIGMPCNVAHLSLISRGHDVSKMRTRYEEMFPTGLVPSPVATTSADDSLRKG